MTVLRGGRTVATVSTADATPRSLASLMVGRELDGPPTDRNDRPAGEIVLRVADLWASGDRGDAAVRGASLQVMESHRPLLPGDEETALALSSALAKRGNIEGALSVLQRAIDAGADTVRLRCARATILSGRLRYDDAERELKRAQKVKPDDVEVLLQQGILACRRAKWREAVEPLARVVRLDPHAGHAHYYLGEALSKLDRLGEALEAYHRAAELEPDNWRAFKGVGIVLDRMGYPAEAAEYYRRARDGQRG